MSHVEKLLSGGVKASSNAGFMGDVILCLNIFMPGMGTIVHGISTGKVWPIIRGILQALFCWVLLFGWAWSIWDGVQLRNEYRKAQEEYEDQHKPTKHVEKTEKTEKIEKYQ